MKNTIPFYRTARMFAVGTVACLTLAACSPDNDPQPSTTNNSPTVVNPESETPRTPNVQTPGNTTNNMNNDTNMNNGMNNNNTNSGMNTDANASAGYGSSMNNSSAAVPGENLDTDRGVGTVPPTTYSD